MLRILNNSTQLTGHRGTVGSVAISSSGDCAVSGAYRDYGSEHEIRVWDLSNEKQSQEIRTGLNGIFSLAFSPDCQHVLVGGGGTVDQGGWQYTSGVEVWRLDGSGMETRFGRELYFVKSIAFSHDRDFLVTSNLRTPNGQGANDETCVTVWRTSDFSKVAAFGRHEVGIGSACFSPDGQRVVFASNQGGGPAPLQANSSLSRRLLSKFHLKRNVEVALHDLNSMAPLIRVWNVGERIEEPALQLSKGRIERVAFSPSGRLLSSAGSALGIYEFSTRALIKQLDHIPSSYSICVAFSPDETVLASGGGYQVQPGSPYQDCGVKLWDVQSGSVVAFLPHRKPVHSLAFSPDGRKLVAGGELGDLLMWNL